MIPRPKLHRARRPWLADPIWSDRLVLALFVLVFALVSTRMGTDNNWDLRNYHLYNGMLAFDGRDGLDLAVAQEHSFDNRLLDTVWAGLRLALNGHPKLLLAVMAVPEGVAAYLTWRIALEVLPAGLAYRQSLAAMAVVFGATGIAGFSTMGTTMTEMLQGSLVLAGVLLLLRQRLRVSWGMVVAGVLFGAAAGLKLTIATAGVGAAAALLGAPGRWRDRLGRTALFGLGGAAGLLAVAGPWWLHVFAATGNPVFPFYNDIFRSPWGVPEAMTDDGAKPATWLRAMAYPFVWAFHRQSIVTEAWSRDPRCAIAYCAMATLLLRPRRLAPGAAWVCLFVACSYAAWQWEFSILRYLAPIELLSGVVVLLAVLAVGSVLGPAMGRFGAHAAMAAVLAACVVRTDYPQWGRVASEGVAARVRLPALPDGSTVILLDQAALSYIAAFAPRSVRFVAASNAAVQPGRADLLSEQAERAIRAAITTPGVKLWGLEGADFAGSSADGTLAYYGLRRAAPCTPVETNLGGDGERLCPLSRAPA